MCVCAVGGFLHKCLCLFIYSNIDLFVFFLVLLLRNGVVAKSQFSIDCELATFTRPNFRAISNAKYKHTHAHIHIHYTCIGARTLKSPGNFTSARSMVVLKVKGPNRWWCWELCCSFRSFVRICIFVNVNIACLSYLPFFTNSPLLVQRKSTACLIIVFLQHFPTLFIFANDRYYSLASQSHSFYINFRKWHFLYAMVCYIASCDMCPAPDLFGPAADIPLAYLKGIPCFGLHGVWATYANYINSLLGALPAANTLCIKGI